MADRLKHHVGRPLDPEALDRDLLLLTGSSRYESATYRIDDATGRPELVVELTPPAHGPPFLALALDLQNTQGSSVSATVRGRMLLFDTVGRNSEARIDFSLGNTLAIGGEVYRPVGRAGFFVAPRAFAYRRDVPVFQDQTYIAEYREEHGGGSIDAGFTTAYRLETRAGYTAEHVRAGVRIGASSLPGVDGPQQYVSAQVKFDGQTGPTIPERGWYVKADLRQFLQVPDVTTATALSAADPDDLTSGRAMVSLFAPVRKRGRVFMGGSVGSSFGGATVVNAFELGGPLRLGAFYPGELRASNAVVVNLGYFHELARFAEGTIGRLWFGSWIDEGSAYRGVLVGAVLHERDRRLRPGIAPRAALRRCERRRGGPLPHLLQPRAAVQVARYLPFRRAARTARNSVPGFHSGYTGPCATASPTLNSNCASSTAPLRSQSAFTSSLGLW